MSKEDTPVQDREPEIWVLINGYEHNYLISSHGQVKSISWHRTGKSKIMKPIPDKDGYLTIALCKNSARVTKKIHRLVGEHFILNPDNLPEINHKYGNKKNNYYIDLEWSTRPENIKHSYETRLKPKTTEKQRNAVTNNNSLKAKIVYQYSKQMDLVAIHKSLSAAALASNGDAGNISACCLGKIKTSIGFIWSYKKYNDGE